MAECHFKFRFTDFIEMIIVRFPVNGLGLHLKLSVVRKNTKRNG